MNSMDWGQIIAIVENMVTLVVYHMLSGWLKLGGKSHIIVHG